MPASETVPQLYYFVGSVNLDGNKAKLGTNLQTNSTLDTGDESLAEVKLSGETAVQLRENARATVSKMDTQWDINVSRGAALNLVQSGTSCRHKGPAAVIAVRGTIFYVNCYDDSTQYICTCNGAIEILAGD